MAKQQLYKLRLTIIGTGLSLSLACISSPVALASSSDTLKTIHEGSELAHCLNRQSTSITFESQTTSNGAIQDTTRITHFTASEDLERINECVQSARTCQNSNLLLPLAIHTKELEPHSAWDPSDRMRLSDLVTQTLTEKAQGSGHFITANEEDISDYRLALLGKASQIPDLVMETTIRYFGALISTEPLNEWVAPTRSAQLEIRLINQRSGKIYSERKIKIKLPLTIRSRDTSGSTDRKWLNLVRQIVESQGLEMLESFRCAPPLLTAQTVSDNQIAIQLRGVRGLTAGQGLLLVPRNQLESQKSNNDQRNWPIVRISSLDEQRAKGDLISGSSAPCRDSDCVAIPL